jgi:hypothetical protein
LKHLFGRPLLALGQHQRLALDFGSHGCISAAAWWRPKTMETTATPPNKESTNQKTGWVHTGFCGKVDANPGSG